MFRPVEARVSFPRLEEEVLRFWKDRDIYAKSLKARQGGRNFVFYEGPPTANGLPHPGHCLTRAIKDVFPRYRTMRGDLCERRAGWDTHGLPVEVEVCKELGIHSKEDIEAYGVEPFIQKCQQSVWRYMTEWRHLTERLGFWVSFEDEYVTYHQSYVESIWWALKTMFDRGLLYQGHKIVWWWAQGGTALSSGEVGQGYRTVADPSVYVKFPLFENETTPAGMSLLVWTTTPWTLSSNLFAAVSPELEYSVVRDPDVPELLVIASALVETMAHKVKRELTVVKTLSGADLIGKRYLPPFPTYYDEHGPKQGGLLDGSQEFLYWRVVSADFVSAESGTGVVHQAPAFGEVDFEVLQREAERFQPGQGPKLLFCVGPDGKFTSEFPEFAGRWVKDADKDIVRHLREDGTLYHYEQYSHEYPFCWRAEKDPLIQYPRESWFVRTTKFRDAMLANNQTINWLPEHIKNGRFGNFLESNVDWALSRERFWGTPLPVWQCEATGKQEALGSYPELLGKPGVSGTEVWTAAKEANPDLPDDLQVHKPYIDAITYDSPFQPGARMRRVPEVIDCWFDSGAMPFAQWGYPHKNVEEFQAHFPADFISEAIDQTRGWFYSLVAISTLLFGPDAKQADGTEPGDSYPLPFRNCIVLGLMLSEWWEDKASSQVFLTEEDALQTSGEGKYSQLVGKMSKSKRNYREPGQIFDVYGADALRWYFFSNQAPWTEIRYAETAIRDSVPEFLLRLWNVYSFFVIYANIDGFDPSSELSGQADDLKPEVLAKAKGYRPTGERSELDRFILAELRRMSRDVVAAMDAYDNFTACKAITAFVDVLSNWYVRRSRDRFWSNVEEGNPQDKADAYWTLYECLVTTSKIIAPFVPFLAETLWQNLAREPFGDSARESVHLCDYPLAEVSEADETLARQMEVVLEIVSSGRAARSEAKIKVRQPLGKVEVILNDPGQRPWLESHADLMAEELNVKRVEFTEAADEYIDYELLPDLKKLGPKLGKNTPVFRKHLQTVNPAALLAEMTAKGEVSFDLNGTPLVITRDELLVRLKAKPGWAASQGAHAVVVLSTEINEELILEGLAREIVHAIQGQRKETGCEYTDRIEVGVVTEDAELRAAVEKFSASIARETLAVSIALGPLAGVEPISMKLAGKEVDLYVRVVALTP